jgi:hypothetical protein
MKLKPLAVAGSVLLLLVVIVAWVLWPGYLLHSAATALDELYVQYRPFPYRWNGVHFSPAKAYQSGNCAPVPEETLASARLAIEDAIRRSEETARSLRLRGRIDLLRCEPSAAQSDYKLALLLQPDDPSLSLELGIALALEAAADPQLAHDGALDYEAAMESMLRADRGGHSAEFLFDSALLFEAAQLPIQAEEKWTEAASVENPTQWGNEDQERLSQLHGRIEKRWQTISQFFAPPDVVLKESNDLRDGSELALDAAVEKWLPEIGQPGVSRRGLQKLGDLLVSYHHDRWLLDVLKAGSSGETQNAFNSLALAVNSNLTGEHQEAADWAQKAEESFRKSHNVAGELRARVEKAYAFARLSKTGDCLNALKGLRPEAKEKSYTWIAAQAWLGDNYCRTLTRQEDVIKSRREVYNWIAGRTHYEGLRLRARGFMTEEYVSADSRLTLWREGEQGLRSFWNEPLPALRGYSLYYTLADSAHQAGNSNTAIAFLREGSMLLKGQGHKLIRASMLSYLGARQLEANRTDKADATFSEMAEEYGGLSSGAAQGFRRESEVIHAAALISTGHAQQGLQRLEQLTGTSSWPFNNLIGRVRRPLFPAFGDAYVRLDQLQDACLNYHESIVEALEQLQKISDPAQRDNGLHEIEPAWRGMTAVMLKMGHSEDALAVWEEFRSLRHVKDVEALLQNPDCSFRTPPAPLSTVGKVNVLVYAFLPSGLSAWLVNGNGTKQEWIDARAPALAARFAELVATKDSPLENVSAVGRELYGLLLGPFGDNLPPDGTIVVDAEGVLAGIPWQALEDDKGRLLVERFAFSQTVGLAGVPGPQDDLQIDLSHALIFASPTLPQELNRYPALPHVLLQATRLHHNLPDSVLFTDEKATATAFRKNASQSTLFHFAGHGISYGGFGALLLAALPGRGPANDAYFTAHEIADIPLPRMQLVVLASCSSGVGEQSGVINLDSLTRAFLEASAQRVIASSWEVDSSATADLMAAFYDRLESGNTTAESLRQAELAVRQAKSHPYYWAGFRVFGRP